MVRTGAASSRAIRDRKQKNPAAIRQPGILKIANVPASFGRILPGLLRPFISASR